MCQMVSNVCGGFTGGISSFCSGSLDQIKIIGEIARKSFFCDFRGAFDSVSSTNLGGKFLLGVIGAVTARVIYLTFFPPSKEERI